MPVPSRRQRRLFDDTREAEKVLHWLEARQPRDVARLLVATMAHAAVATLSHHAAPVEVPGLDVAVRHIAARAEMLSRAPALDFRRYEVSYNTFYLFVRFTSLKEPFHFTSGHKQTKSFPKKLKKQFL